MSDSDIRGSSTCVSLTRVWRWVLIGLIAAIGSRAEAAELWEFVRVGKGNQSEPTWSVHNGKAQVEDDGQRLTIFAYYNEDDTNGRANPGDIARIVIRGTIAPDHTIQATSTLLNTDAHPAKLTGRYTVRTEHETWGAVRKTVIYKEIVFGRPPNPEFIGFLNRDVRDE
jgi:hypothetical protein